MYRKYIKRMLDIIISMAALVVSAVPMAIIAVVIRMTMGRNILFIQERPGKNSKIFRILKFRTMTDARDKNGKLLPDEVRLTSFGKFLRRTSLDELPQLWNILKGEMSIVGPRPLLVEYLPMYTPEQKCRHTVRPGLTNLVAVNGRNDVPMEKKLEYDQYYVQNLSFKLDLYIVLKTFFVVVKGGGVELEASDKMKEIGRAHV